MNRMVLMMVRVVALILTIALWCWLLGCTLRFVASRLSGADPWRPIPRFRPMPLAHRQHDEAEKDHADARVPDPRWRGHI